MKSAAIITFLLATLFAAPAPAEVYRYTDSSGELHYVDEIAKVPKKYRKQLENARPLADNSITASTPAPRRPEQTQPQAATAAHSDARVEVYLTSWCGYCRKTVKFLTEKGIPYTAYDIEKDRDAHRIYNQLGGNGVPVVRIGEKVIHGYNPDAILNALGKR